MGGGGGMENVPVENEEEEVERKEKTNGGKWRDVVNLNGIWGSGWGFPPPL